MVIQLANFSFTHEKIIVEDVIVKENKFMFTADLVTMDMDVPLLLGRSFLRTGRLLIDVAKDELTIRVNKEEAHFSVVEALKFPYGFDECKSVREVLKEEFHE